jgi:putative membrane protein
LFTEILALTARWAVISFSLFVAAYIVVGISIHDFWSGLAAAALLGIVNTVVRPVLVVLTLPITLFTLGLFLLIINALMLQLVAWAISGFFVSGFWAALKGSLIISIVSWIINRFFYSGVHG